MPKKKKVKKVKKVKKIKSSNKIKQSTKIIDKKNISANFPDSALLRGFSFQGVLTLFFRKFSKKFLVRKQKFCNIYIIPVSG